MEPLPSLHAVPFTDHLMPMVLLSINTGMRRGELFDLKWSHVNFDRRIVTVSAQTAKSRKTRHIPLNAEAFETLKAWRSQCDLCQRRSKSRPLGGAKSGHLIRALASAGRA
ncbi:tyrosine-type recombinase/integrase [Porphyrobacter sp. TH134]|uniref:tyrosine-type recombinase/integrase n=1 Tax=Porphyrobacter sp. TH134 TaxID=2067450 RepID=UPI00118033FD|nr:tyrosine-type recombinase/integrase [Porphyrobacter sp. TH134]